MRRHVTAGQQIETAQNTLKGGKGTEVMWLVWSKDPSADLDAVKNAGFAAKGAINGPDQAILQAFLDKYTSEPRDASKDTANQQTVIKANGDVIVHRFEIEHR